MMSNHPTTIRGYAKFVNFPVIGKLKRVVGNTNVDGTKPQPHWLDEVGNEYMGNARSGFCIITVDGAVL